MTVKASLPVSLSLGAAFAASLLAGMAGTAEAAPGGAPQEPLTATSENLPAAPVYQSTWNGPGSEGLLHMAGAGDSLEEIIVPNWGRPRELYVDQGPTLFRYVDRAPDTRQSLIDLDTHLNEGHLRCLGTRVFTSETPVPFVLFGNLPVRDNNFTISCTGNCDNLKYAIFRDYDGIITHSGTKKPFPEINVEANMRPNRIGFLFFESIPGGDVEALANRNSGARVPAGATVVITHHGDGIASALRLGKSCSHASPQP